MKMHTVSMRAIFFVGVIAPKGGSSLGANHTRHAKITTAAAAVCLATKLGLFGVPRSRGVRVIVWECAGFS